MVVIKDGDELEKEICTIVTYHHRRYRLGLQSGYVPDEIWLEILSRLPIKSLLRNESTCKSWREIASHLKEQIVSNPQSVPLCGLLLRSYSLKEEASQRGSRIHMSYICLRTKKSIDMQTHHKLTVSSGCKSGLLGDLCFDFTALHTVSPLNPKWQGFYFTIHRGLLMVVRRDGTYQVHNPATKQVFEVPKSPLVEEYGTDFCEERKGVIIQFPLHPGYQCQFVVVRFCRKHKMMEVYFSITARWKSSYLTMEDEFVDPINYWILENYVAFHKDHTLYLFFLSKRGHGVATKFKGPNNPRYINYCFPLPEAVHGKCWMARLWECQGSLLLSLYHHNELRIWKQPDFSDSTGGDSWVWVPLLEISNTRMMCRPVAREHLAKVVLDASDFVAPLACHPDVPLVFLLVKSSVLAYDLTNDTLHKVAEINDHNQSYTRFNIVLTYKPCLSSLNPLK